MHISRCGRSIRKVFSIFVKVHGQIVDVKPASIMTIKTMKVGLCKILFFFTKNVNLCGKTRIKRFTGYFYATL